MKHFVPLINNGYTCVSSEDFKAVREHKWRHKNGYARRAGGGETVLMHRFVVKRMIDRSLTSGEWVDHIDRNRCNNQRSNLRVASPDENRRNSKVAVNNTSGYRGVRYHRNGYWVAYIGADKERYYLGRYKKAVEAARVYDAAARKMHGEYASLNFPKEETTDKASGKLEKVLATKGQLGSSSRFYGVGYRPEVSRANPWTARVCSNGKRHYLGYHPTEREAALAVDECVRKRGLDKPINLPEATEW